MSSSVTTTVHSGCILIGYEKDTNDQVWIFKHPANAPVDSRTGLKPGFVRCYVNPNLDRRRKSRTALSGGQQNVVLHGDLSKHLQDNFVELEKSGLPEFEFIIREVIDGNIRARQHTGRQLELKEYWVSRRGKGPVLDMDHPILRKLARDQGWSRRACTPSPSPSPPSRSARKRDREEDSDERARKRARTKERTETGKRKRSKDIKTERTMMDDSDDEEIDIKIESDAESDDSGNRSEGERNRVAEKSSKDRHDEVLPSKETKQPKLNESEMGTANEKAGQSEGHESKSKKPVKPNFMVLKSKTTEQDGSKQTGSDSKGEATMKSEVDSSKDKPKKVEDNQPVESGSELKKTTKSDVESSKDKAKEGEENKHAARHSKPKTTVTSSAAWEYKKAREAEWARQMRKSSAKDSLVVTYPWFPHTQTSVGMLRLFEFGGVRWSAG